MTHYEVLGLARGAEPAEVRAAYLRSARRHHPDVHAGADPATRRWHEQQMRLVTQAWAVLGDPVRRAAYDRRPDVHEPAAEPLDERLDDGELLDAEPVSGARPGRALVMAPATMLVAAALALGGSLVFRSPALLALAGLAAVGALALFVLAPFLVMVAARRGADR
ncbi:MAG: J domain-containing protein [Acidimicrobiales bacterium]|nr:J domain-containing protein [Acidimicrobiales bacterium]